MRSIRRDREKRSTVEIVIARYEQHDESPQLEGQIAKAFDLADGFCASGARIPARTSASASG